MTNIGFLGYPSPSAAFTQTDTRYPGFLTSEGASATATATTPRIMPGGRAVSANSVGLTAGKVFLVGFTAPANQMVSQMVIRSRGTAAASTTTLARMGIYAVDALNNLRLLAQTASDTALCSVTFTNYTKAFDASGGYGAQAALQQGQRYAAAVIFVGNSTAAQVYGMGLGPELALATPFLQAQVASQSDLAATYAAASVTQDGTIPAFQIY